MVSDDLYFGSIDSELNSELSALEAAYRISREELFYKFESFAVLNGFLVVDQENLVLFKQFLKQSQNTKNSGDLMALKKSKMSPIKVKKEFNHLMSSPLVSRAQEYGRSLADTGKNPMSSPQQHPLNHLNLLSSPGFGTSAFTPTKLNKIVPTQELIYNQHIKDTNQTITAAVNIIETQQTAGYRYMYEKLTEKGDLLNQRITDFAEIYKNDTEFQKLVQSTLEDHQMKKESTEPVVKEELSESLDFNFGHPAMASQEARFYIGRISCDSLNEGVRLNLTSVILETSKEIGAGCRTKVDFSAMVASGSSLHIFAGQIVCLLATNPTGTCLLVQKLIPPPNLPMGTSNGDSYISFYPNDAPSKHLSILVAAGPYTAHDSLEYEVLQKLLDYAESQNPSALVLLGPFVDTEHPMLKNPVNLEQDLTFEQIFASKVAANLMKLLTILPDLKIVLVPSQRDAILEWVAYPQPPIGSAISGEDQIQKLQELGLISSDGTVSINLFPNPVQFTINEVIIGISNLDTLLDMIQYGYTISTERDNFTMVFENIINQRHFYPVFPSSSGTNLDTTRALKTTDGPCVLQVKPDILITPSRMMYAVRNAETLCINPGFVVKGRTTGTFAKILVHPLQTEGMGVDDVFEHAIADRSRVEIIKL